MIEEYILYILVITFSTLYLVIVSRIVFEEYLEKILVYLIMKTLIVSMVIVLFTSIDVVIAYIISNMVVYTLLFTKVIGKEGGRGYESRA